MGEKIFKNDHEMLHQLTFARRIIPHTFPHFLLSKNGKMGLENAAEIEKVTYIPNYFVYGIRTPRVAITTLGKLTFTKFL